MMIMISYMFVGFFVGGLWLWLMGGDEMFASIIMLTWPLFLILITILWTVLVTADKFKKRTK